ncbi:envelope stress response membrane protein PspC [Sphingomonas sp. GCM10030256]|uniref:envelope stress response membrane protein PspC n=1 Tax=Sphingomonas sp. GCM10030256 TaxID=3273427 RepID=UPI00360DBFA2
MPVQPPSRTRFYKDKRGGKFMGVCAGIADYTGLDVTLVRIAVVSLIILSSLSLLPVYIIAGFVADDKPRELRPRDDEEQRFWQGVRQSPARTARDIRSRFREIDRRLADVESYVLTNNRSLDREIEQLR